MDRMAYLQATALLVMLQVLGAHALESDIIGITVAACVSFFLLCVVITMVVVSFTWTNWYNSWMRGKGKVRMPREYFEKKEEARRRLLAESANQSVRSAHSVQRSRPASVNRGNGHPPNSSIDRAQWVQGWNQNNSPRELETLGATMVLEDEQEEEFKIETILVDNEVLDVGPYSKSQSDDKPVQGDVYSVPYIYSSGDKGNGNANSTTAAATTTTTTNATIAEETTPVGLALGEVTSASGGEMIEVKDASAYATVGEAQTLEDMVVRL